MRYKSLLFLLIIVSTISFDSVAQALWEIDKNKQGIKVYTKFEKESDFKSFKAVITVSASIADIIEILKNADGYKKWYEYTKTSKLLKEEKDVQYNYVETIFPWPYSNRDMVYRMAIQTNMHGAVKISLKGISDYIPEKRGIVRMKKAEGYILLQPIDDKTEITYIFHSEPGSNVPSWLANNSIADLPFKTLSGLRKTLDEKKSSSENSSWKTTKEKN